MDYLDAIKKGSSDGRRLSLTSDGRVWLPTFEQTSRTFEDLESLLEFRPSPSAFGDENEVGG